MKKELKQALSKIHKDAEKQLKEAIKDENYSHAATAQAYLNGIEVVIGVINLISIDTGGQR